MKKKFAILTGALMTVALSAVFFANKPLTAQEALILRNVEAIARGETSVYCHNGGEGALNCSIDAGISIAGYGVSGGCSVTCGEGYYACCNLRCTCKED